MRIAGTGKRAKWNNLRSPLVVVLIAGGLSVVAGCTGGPSRWVNSAADAPTQQKDFDECRRDAEVQLRTGPYAAERERQRIEALAERPRQGSVDQSQLRQLEIRDQLERERLFRVCLTARGYRQERA